MEIDMDTKDSHGFQVWTDDDRTSKWDQDTTIQELLLSSKKLMLDPFEAMDEGVKPNEIGYHYSYGGFMAERGGILVVKRDDPTKIIRAKQTWLS